MKPSRTHNGTTRAPFFYGWVIVALTFINFPIIYGIRTSFTVFFVAILQEFEWSRANTSLILSLNILTYGLLAPLAGALVDRFGPRRIIPAAATVVGLGTVALAAANELWHFYLLFGVLVGFAMVAAGYVAYAPVLINWFVKRRGTALGIAMAGWGGSFVSTFFVQYLISQYGWRWAYGLLGAIPLVIIVPLASAFLRTRPQDMALLPDGEASLDRLEVAQKSQEADRLIIDRVWVSSDWTLAKAIRTFRFWALFFAAFFGWGISWSLMLAHQTAFMVDVGYSAMMAAGVFAFMGVLTTVGNLAGFISDRIGREWAYTLGYGGAALGVVLLLIVRDLSTPWLLYFYAAFFGAGVGLVGPTTTAATADLFQGRGFGGINGFIVMGFGPGGALGPWLGGLIYDLSGSYTPAFVLVIASALMACAAVWLAAPRKVRLVPGQASRWRRKVVSV